ncbi:potassium transporter Kup [Thiovibrio frasassiensis]|uniref:Probable potassium transport system protein Kup n=1 Tax=Thiovibrio frasassiensis TaxID=2984131 RepID=A0A9X4MH70_9BACT|nr:potassium transporter Kup [Thiovibrio frasassiensis]MDG4476313.1 potassium transporter Kup [Thiovibrio frasassiensis]
MNAPATEMSGKQLSALSLAALGVVFGDIGTSPLYAMRECFHGEYGIAVTSANVLGVLSLIFWALLLIVSIKYLGFILRADNEGEGGVLALTALIKPKNLKRHTPQWVLVCIGLFAACLMYGDGMITPAISVLSAVEGVKNITPFFEPYIIPATILILSGLFLIQKKGTARVGRLFGPIMLLWFCMLAALGIAQIVSCPRILVAVFPWHGISFLLENRIHGFIVLGAVFLVVTGAEAIYADMGHFGKRPIQLVWFLIAFPALVLNYFGQGALLLVRPEEAYHPFYAMVPDWAMIPMVLLATMATIIASQAVITGSFSLTRQAIQLGYLPRLRITHTSSSHIGQIYVGPVNWALMLCTIGLVLGFQSSSKLAAAYGVAVSATMLITSTLFFVVASKRWGWSRLTAGLLAGLFFMVDLPFLGANMSKIFHGAWFALAIGGFFFLMMLTWEQGREILGNRMRSLTPKLEEFKEMLISTPPQRINGQAVFLTRGHDIVPAALMHNLKHNKILHSEVVFLNIRTEEIPRVPNFEKIEAEKLGAGLYRIIAHYGFMEEPKIDTIFALASSKGLNLDMKEASFFLGREKLSIGEHPEMWRWRSQLFLFLARNAMDAAAFFDIPSDQVIEVGVQLEL